jgi:hypothetical protein
VTFLRYLIAYEDMLGNAALDGDAAELVLDARPNARQVQPIPLHAPTMREACKGWIAQGPNMSTLTIYILQVPG